MPTKEKGGSGGYSGNNDAKKARARTLANTAEAKQNKFRIERKAEDKAKKALCPSERAAEAKRLVTRQSLREMGVAEAGKGQLSAADQRKRELELKKESSRNNGKGQGKDKSWKA
jgi:hypothetical protein